MKLKKDLQVKLFWENNKGYLYDTILNFPLDNGMKADFEIRVSVVENVDNPRKYDMFKVDVENLQVFSQDNEYVMLKANQEKNLIDSINKKVMW